MQRVDRMIGIAAVALGVATLSACSTSPANSIGVAYSPDTPATPVIVASLPPPPKRAERIVKLSTGFVYCVTVAGITGERDRLPNELLEQLRRLRTMTDLPLCVGFGVSKPEHVRDLKEIADGVIVGSALVKKLETAAIDRTGALAGVRKLVSELSGALQ